MVLTLKEFLQIDLPAMAVAMLAALTCGLLGNFLILRRQALVGDAMSHAVLPGLVLGFLWAGSLAALPMMLGALGAALLAAGLIEAVRRFGRVEPGAAMGVVFTTMFAFGVLLLEQQGSGVHLDAQHALFGQLEATLWLGPQSWGDVLRPEMLAALPGPLKTLATVAFLVIVATGLFFKEWRLIAFDPEHAAGLGMPVRRMEAAFVGLVGAAAVAAFWAVGSILVIAMFICPAATARMLTDRLVTQVWLSAGFAIAAGLLGYILAAWAPLTLGMQHSLNAAGMIAVTAGGFQTAAMLFAPRYGVFAQRRRLAT